MITVEQEKKLCDLKEYLKKLQSVAVAYSSGVDSTFLLKVAKDVLKDQVIAVTAKSCSFPKRELDEALLFCEEEGIKHVICETDELSIEGFAKNPPDRCYICKKAIFNNFINAAKAHGITNVVEGSNLDDEGDYRPGLKAISELNIISPLRECNLTKADIRALSKHLGLSTWEKPSYACLSSRFVYGETITAEKLAMVEKAEQLLMDMNFHQIRVRMHGMAARIEIDSSEFSRIVDDKIRTKIYKEFKNIGFTYVSLDLLGYRTGSMNETL